jgi:hypothetical protein
MFSLSRFAGGKVSRAAARVGAVLAFAVLALVAAVSAPAMSAGRAAVSTYPDATGDANSAPDLAQMTLTDNGNGTVGVDIKLAGSTDLGSDGKIGCFIDADNNPSTGGDGAEFLVAATSSGALVGHWDGTSFVQVTTQPINSSFNGTDLTFTLILSDFGTSSFGFVVAGIRGNDVDVAPESGEFSYPQAPPPAAPTTTAPATTAPVTTTAPAAPAPTVDKILVGAGVLFPKAGRVYRIKGVQVMMSTGEIVKPTTVTCRLTLRGKALRALQGGCAWRIPKTYLKKKLVLIITASYRGASGSFRLSVVPS